MGYGGCDDHGADPAPGKVYAPSEISVLLNQFTQTATATLSNVSVSGVETHQIEASYAGSTGFSGSVSSTVPLLAVKISTSLKLSSSAATLIAGNLITLTATLSPYMQAPFTTDGDSVTFYNGGTSVGTATLSAGVATLNIVTLPVGSDKLTVGYSGDANFSGSTSNTVTVTVSQVPTTLQLYSNPNPSAQGAQVTLTAALNPFYSGSFGVRDETITFYNGKTAIGTSTIASGVATLTVSNLPKGTDTLIASYPSDGVFASATSNSVQQAVGVLFGPIPAFVVTVNTDTTTGVASNCTSSPAPNCSLRDALAAAFAAGSGNITFDSKVFATPQTIAGGQSIPPHTTITGPTTGSGATLTNLVTVSGGGPVFTVNSYVTNAVISNLIITGGAGGASGGGGILNRGALVVSGCAISGNSGGGYQVVSGGGIENYGTLTLINSTVAGNSVTVVGNEGGTIGQGAGIDNAGTLTISNSSVVGNSVTGNAGGGIASVSAFGGGIDNYGTLTMTNSIVAGNNANATVEPGSDPADSASAGGGGIYGGVTAGANNIISGNTSNGSEDDCDTYSGAPACPTSGQNGNLVGVGVQLAPFGSYGGPTQTQPPLPGSTAICAGVVADIPSGTTTDQRGFPRTTTYGSNPPCVDSGSVQTNYSLKFSTEPPSTIPATTSFTAAVQVNESGNTFPVSGLGISIALATGDNGSLNVSSLSTNSSGIASDSQLQISATGNDKLVATLPLTAAGITPAAVTSTTSTAINVTPSAAVQVTVGASPAGLTFMVDGVSYTATTTLVWPLGSQHTLSTTSPQGSTGTQYTFASWSDGGAITHTVTASTATINYTVTFNTSYLLTISANPSKGGTVSPASGYSPANSSVTLTATANPGYIFTSWTGNVASNSSPTTSITMSGPETVAANFTAIPIYTVNTNLDDRTGTAANCGSGSKAPCSLRDALAAAGAATSGGDIEFDPTVFAASQPATARNIVLGSAQTLNVPDNTRIFGPTTGNGATLTQLVAINGKNLSNSNIFSTGNNTVLSGLAIVDDTSTAISNGGPLAVIDCAISGNNTSDNVGGAIFNNSVLTVMGSTISGNSSSGGGGGIFNNFGSLTVIDSTISGNNAPGGPPVGLPEQNGGGGIYNYAGTLTVINSTISGNTNTGIVAYGGMYSFDAAPPVTIANSTISGNAGGGINVAEGMNLNTGALIPVTLTVTDSILSGNTTNGSEDDCDETGTSCPTSGQNGNFVGSGAQLAPLGNYDGPTQTQPPLPGSPAICAGLIADVPSQITTDQRGLPRTTTYGSNPPCVDSGSVQTNYSLKFSKQPPASVPPSLNFTAAVQLSESGNPFPVSGIAVPIALGAGDPGSLNVSSLVTNASGIAGSSTLQVNAEGTGNTLVAKLPVTTSPPPAPLTSPISISATSSAFNVGQTSQTITFGALPNVTYGVSPITLTATASSGLPVSYTVTGPATVSGSTLTVTGAGTVAVTASQAGNAEYAVARSVIQSFTVAKAALTVTANNASIVYGRALPSFSYTITGFAGTDKSSVVSGTAMETTTATSTSAPGSYPITFSIESLTATNYTFTYVNGKLTISDAAQTITFTAPANPVIYGVAPISLSATASSGLAVTFSVLSGPGTMRGSTLSVTGAGAIVVAANQAGNADYTAAAQVTQTIIVNKATPSLSLVVTPATPAYGTLLTFTGASAPAGSTSTEFSFLIDKGTANSAILSATILANGTVTATDGQLKAGAHTVELDFTGTPNYTAATSPIVPVSVTQATPTITWTPAGSIPYGTKAASLLSATANTPGSFTYAAQAVGSSPIPLSSATVLAAGSYTLTANFAPTDTVDYKSATQTSQLVVANKTLTVTANNAARVYGTANPTFTGTVVGAVNGDAFTETFSTTATASSNVGTYAIVPTVTGPNLADYAVTVKNGTLTLTQAASTTALTSSTSNANLNASVTFTATVISSTSGTPGGAVQFLNGSTVLGMSPLNTQGVAAYSTTELSAGSNAINAVYAGDQNFISSMAELMQQVTAPAFSLKSSVNQLSLIGGDTGQLNITLTPVGGYTGMTSFSCAGLPQNATCSFNPPTLTADGSNSPVTITMTIATDSPGSGTVGLLRPQSPGTSALLASLAGLPASLAGLILFWQRRRLSPFVRRLFCAILLIGGLTGSVAISACGGSSQLKTPPGTSTISVMATGSGNISQSITITLTVTQ